MEDNRSFVSAQKEDTTTGTTISFRDLDINSKGDTGLDILSQQTVVKGPVRAIPVSIA